MTVAARPNRTRAPIGLQLVALLLLSLLVAQAISFALIIFMPPPRPPIYRISEVAAALRGGPLKTRQGRPLIRTFATDLPSDLRNPIERERLARALSTDLGVSEANVRLSQQGPSPAWMLMREFEGRPAMPGGPRGDRSRGGPGGGGPMPDRGEGGPRGGRSFGPDPSIFGEFSAAYHPDTGGWIVVRSTPEPFPNAWQQRAGLWLLAGFLLVAPAGYLFARRITAPLKRFVDAAETLGRDPHAPQMTLTGPAEVGAAAHAFNDMQARLQRYIQDRTAMVGAISHDLRTPLARIRFKLESAPDALKDSVLADVAQMEHMIGGVLAFIRDEGQAVRRERLDLLSLVECVADDAALVGGDAEVLETSQPVTVLGDPVALQRLFSNLVDNAVKYGGQARINVRPQGDTAVVTIADAGPGLSGAELEKVFQPFYRSDSSRNLDQGGVGLGLPIARSTAHAHGGDIQLSSGMRGVTATVTLPVSP